MKIWWNENSKFNVPGAEQGMPDTFNERNVVKDANGNDLSEMLILGIDTETGEIEYFKKTMPNGEYVYDINGEPRKYLEKYAAPLTYERKSKDQLDEERENDEDEEIYFVYWQKGPIVNPSFGIRQFKIKERAEEFVDALTSNDDFTGYLMIKGHVLEEMDRDAFNECQSEN